MNGRYPQSISPTFNSSTSSTHRSEEPKKDSNCTRPNFQDSTDESLLAERAPGFERRKRKFRKRKEREVCATNRSGIYTNTDSSPSPPERGRLSDHRYDCKMDGKVVVAMADSVAHDKATQCPDLTLTSLPNYAEVRMQKHRYQLSRRSASNHRSTQSTGTNTRQVQAGGSTQVPTRESKLLLWREKQENVAKRYEERMSLIGSVAPETSENSTCSTQRGSDLESSQHTSIHERKKLEAYAGSIFSYPPPDPASLPAPPDYWINASYAAARHQNSFST
ncbi:unnamed protein product [Clavelina lepadiformis]|uniref:Uncharacterized protein n=1 Tax=Clavelina lepadiformis TaxID=159417 RepID=A0ABP0FP46_CLALP